MSDIRWLDDALIAGVKTTPAPRSPYTTGYGGKVPTRHMLKIRGRWHRVYMMQYGNSGTPYVQVKGADLVLETATEHRIEKHIEGVGSPIPLNQLAEGDRFRFHSDGVAATLTALGERRYMWHDYQGDHYLICGTYSGTGKTAWPYVYPTTDPETEVTLP